MKFFWRPVYRMYRIISGSQYRLNRRFTRAGMIVLGGVMVTGFMGLDPENNLAYQAFAVLTCMLGLALVWAMGWRAQFTAERRLPRFGTVGQALAYSIHVRNDGKRAQRGLALLENIADPRPGFHEWVATQVPGDEPMRSFRVNWPPQNTVWNRARVRDAKVPPVNPGQSADVLGELTPLRRGVLRFEGLTLARPDPLGLFNSFLSLKLPQTTLILPKRYALPDLALPGQLQYQKGGVALASNIGQSDEFISLRDYRPGDPPRHIHWRSWAKTGKPVVKEFEDEFFVRHALVLDTFTRHPARQLFEEAVSVAASFACAVQTQESLLDLLFVGAESYCFTAGRGLGQTDQMLEILASVGPCATRPFSTLTRLVLTHIAAVSGCVCVLLSWDEERRDLIRKLRALGVPLLVLVLKEHGSAAGVELGPMADAPHDFRVLELGKIEAGLARLGKR